MQGLVQDVYRFTRYHRDAIETRPLQVYRSGLIFSPRQSMIKQLFQHGHDRVNSVVFSTTAAASRPDRTTTPSRSGMRRIASSVSNLSFDFTGSCLHTDVGIVILRDLLTPAPTTSTKFPPSESHSWRFNSRKPLSTKATVSVSMGPGSHSIYKIVYGCLKCIAQPVQL